MIKKIGDINTVLNSYLQQHIDASPYAVKKGCLDKAKGLSNDFEFIQIEILNKNKEQLSTDDTLTFKLQIKRNNPSLKKFNIGCHIININDGSYVATTATETLDCSDKNEFSAILTIPNHNLVEGSYTTNFSIGLKDFSSGITDYDIVSKVINFKISFVKKELQNSYSAWLKHFGQHNILTTTCSIL